MKERIRSKLKDSKSGSKSLDKQKSKSEKSDKIEKIDEAIEPEEEEYYLGKDRFEERKKKA